MHTHTHTHTHAREHNAKGSEREAVQRAVWSVPGYLRVREQAYVIVRERNGVEEAFIRFSRGIVSGRRWFVTQFVHSAVNGLRRPGDIETRA